MHSARYRLIFGFLSPRGPAFLFASSLCVLVGAAPGNAVSPNGHKTTSKVPARIGERQKPTKNAASQKGESPSDALAMRGAPMPMKMGMLAKLKSELNMKPAQWQETVPLLMNAIDCQFLLDRLRSPNPTRPSRRIRQKMWLLVRGKTPLDLKQARDLLAQYRKAKADEEKRIARLEKEFEATQQDIVKLNLPLKQRMTLFLFGLLNADMAFADSSSAKRGAAKPDVP